MAGDNRVTKLFFGYHTPNTFSQDTPFFGYQSFLEFVYYHSWSQHNAGKSPSHLSHVFSCRLIPRSLNSLKSPHTIDITQVTSLPQFLCLSQLHTQCSQCNSCFSPAAFSMSPCLLCSQRICLIFSQSMKHLQLQNISTNKHKGVRFRDNTLKSLNSLTRRSHHHSHHSLVTT